MIPQAEFRVLIAYPNLSMMLTPSYTVGLFTTLLKGQGYILDLFDCTPYMSTLEYLGEPLAVTRANKLPGNSRQFDSEALFGDPKTDLIGDFTRKLEEMKPHVVVFSTVVEDTWPQAREMLDLLTKYPEIKSILGGVYATMSASTIIASKSTQCVGDGEGEKTVIEFCEAVRQGNPTTDILGTHAKGDDDQVISNRPRPLVDINEVIPDFSLFDERRFYRPLGARIWKAIPIETYRGCPYTCTFCNSPAQVIIAREKDQGSYLRRKSMPTLKREIETMIERYQPDFFYINDDAFMARPKPEIAEFAEMYKDIKLPFWMQTRVETLNEYYIQGLEKVGCNRISIGLEHGNEEFRKKIVSKGFSNQRIVDLFTLLDSYSIPITINSILGFPDETRELIFDTIELNRQLGSDSCNAYIFTPYRGTSMFDDAADRGFLNPNEETNSIITQSILDMPSITKDEILGLVRTFSLYVKFPREEWPDIEIAEKSDDFRIDTDTDNQLQFAVKLLNG